MHEVYGIDAGDDSLMESRSWRWLRERILGLFDCAPIFVQNDEGIAKPLAGTRIGRRFQPD